jgi:hypothetical protein
MAKKKAIKRDNSYSDTDNDEKERLNERLDSMDIVESVKAKAKEPVTLRKVLIRSITAILLALLYFSLLMAGHFYCILAVALTQVSSLLFAEGPNLTDVIFNT